jgi:hypothetical protein
MDSLRAKYGPAEWVSASGGIFNFQWTALYGALAISVKREFTL